MAHIEECKRIQTTLSNLINETNYTKLGLKSYDKKTLENLTILLESHLFQQILQIQDSLDILKENSLNRQIIQNFDIDSRTGKLIQFNDQLFKQIQSPGAINYQNISGEIQTEASTKINDESKTNQNKEDTDATQNHIVIHLEEHDIHHSSINSQTNNCQPLNANKYICNLTLHKNKNENIGIIVKKIDSHLFVQSLVQGSIAQKSNKISINDEIVSINGQPISRSLSTKKLQEIIDKANDKLNIQLIPSVNKDKSFDACEYSSENGYTSQTHDTFTTLSKKNLPPHCGKINDYFDEHDQGETYDVELNKNEKGLGITIAGYTNDHKSKILIKDITKGSVVDQDGRIAIGDEIIMVDDRSLKNYDNLEAVKLLKLTGKCVRMKLIRNINPRQLDLLKSEQNLFLQKSPQDETIVFQQKPKQLIIDHTVISSHNNHMENQPSEYSNAVEVNVEDDDDEPYSMVANYWKTLIPTNYDVIFAKIARHKEGGSLGISLEGKVSPENEIHPSTHHHFIHSILPDGPIGIDNTLQSGDEILQVNEVAIMGLPHPQVVSILKELPKNIVFVCGRQKCVKSFKINPVPPKRSSSMHLKHADLNDLKDVENINEVVLNRKNECNKENSLNSVNFDENITKNGTNIKPQNLDDMNMNDLKFSDKIKMVSEIQIGGEIIENLTVLNSNNDDNKNKVASIKIDGFIDENACKANQNFNNNIVSSNFSRVPSNDYINKNVPVIIDQQFSKNATVASEAKPVYFISSIKPSKPLNFPCASSHIEQIEIEKNIKNDAEVLMDSKSIVKISEKNEADLFHERTLNFHLASSHVVLEQMLIEKDLNKDIEVFKDSKYSKNSPKIAIQFSEKNEKDRFHKNSNTVKTPDSLVAPHYNNVLSVKTQNQDYSQNLKQPNYIHKQSLVSNQILNNDNYLKPLINEDSILAQSTNMANGNRHAQLNIDNYNFDGEDLNQIDTEANVNIKTIDKLECVNDVVGHTPKSAAFLRTTSWANEIVYANLIKTQPGLGFSVLDYQHPIHGHRLTLIRSIVKDRAADIEGSLSAGDRLMSVNKVDVSDISLEECVAVLKATELGLVRIGVLKPVSIVLNSKNGNPFVENSSSPMMVPVSQLDDQNVRVLNRTSSSVPSKPINLVSPQIRHEDSNGGKEVLRTTSQNDRSPLRLNTEQLITTPTIFIIEDKLGPIIVGKQTELFFHSSNQFGLGIMVLGGINTLLEGIFICDIYEEGAIAKDGRLQVGDQILKINDVILKDCTNEEALSYLRSPLDFNLTILRDGVSFDKKDSYIVHTFELIKGQGQNLGIYIVGRSNDSNIFISDILTGGVAHMDGCLKIGDQILYINHHPVTNQETTAEILKNSTGLIYMTIGRNNPDIFKANNSKYGRNDIISLELTRYERGSMEMQLVKDPISLPVINTIYSHQPNSKLQLKDKLLSINQVNCELMTILEIYEIIRKSKNVAHINIIRESSSGSVFKRTSPSTRQEQQLQEKHIKIVTLSRSAAGFGFSIAGGRGHPQGDQPFHVKSIFERGPAEEDGRLRRGDRLIAVNGESLDGLTHDEAVQLIRNTETTVILTVIS